jgi:streptogramin lyase
VTVFEPPTKDQGARRVWSDSKGRLWISEWNSGNVSVYDPTDKSWKQWKLPGEKPRTYAVWVDPDDKVWLSEWAANAIVRFDPATEKFESFPSNRKNANVRQMLGRKGETWMVTAKAYKPLSQIHSGCVMCRWCAVQHCNGRHSQALGRACDSRMLAATSRAQI